MRLEDGKMYTTVGGDTVGPMRINTLNKEPVFTAVNSPLMWFPNGECVSPRRVDSRITGLAK